MKSVIRRHPTAAYILLAFTWTWLIAFTMLLTGLADDVANPSPLFILGGILSNISPSLAALLVTRISGGKEAVKKLTGGFKVKSQKGWTLLTLVIVPTVTVLTTVLSSFVFREYRFALVAPMIAMGLVWPLFSGFGEEFGWRGFLLPRLIKRFGLLKAAVLLGILWEVWHLPMHYMAYRAYGVYMIPAFLTVGFLNLTLNAVIMAIIYAVNKGSIKLMVLYHYTITASSIIAGALFAKQASPKFTVYETIISCALFTIIAALLYLKNKSRINLYSKEEISC
jgi:membrane protease YdiL (CAAX protease family)